MAGRLSAWAGPLLDLFYPPACVSCGRALEDPPAPLCGSCLGMVAPLEGGCGRCGAPRGSEAGRGCPTCLSLGPALESIRSAVWFQGPVPELVHAFKYRGMRRLSDWCAGLMLERPELRALLERADWLAPVPLHPWRRWRRGYNQSTLLARALAEATGRPMREDLLRRVRRTGSQTRLDPDQRRRNIAGAFRVSEEEVVRGGTILLVDDVMTTGTTLHECARELVTAGAAAVLACTFARA